MVGISYEKGVVLCERITQRMHEWEVFCKID